MSDGSFFALNGYHFALGAVGAVVILAHWLPRFFSRREPAASGLLILLGMGVFALVPNEGAMLNVASVRDQLEWFQSEGLVDADITLETLIDTSYVETMGS